MLFFLLFFRFLQLWCRTDADLHSDGGGSCESVCCSTKKTKKKPLQCQSCSYDNCLIVSIYNPAECERPLASQSGGIGDGGAPPIVSKQEGWHADKKQDVYTHPAHTHTHTHTLPFPRRCWSLRIRGLSVSLAPLFSFPAQWNYGIASIVSWRQIQGPFIWDCF